ncbi:alpha/beta hydrolase [uncultured Mucilaginibacter sp.]|uniref:alpha/beta hydrolase n=1 Tax=uncultured Mucilaginibacter sp. TaxID=797541 RepID=UPI002612AF5A|nr:alpha/beta hydrolase [uncultured Mucilaginibacter sp.]
MKDYTVTRKRSFLGTVCSHFIRILRFKKRLNNDSFKQLQAYEDTKTPIIKKYPKEVIEGVPMFWINKEKSENGVLVYLPGGGFIIGPTTLHWLYCDKLSKKLDMAVLMVRYPLAPVNPFPNGLNAIVNVITALQKRGDLQQQWFLGGESAGGNLALSVCYLLHQQKASLPKKLLLLYPAANLDTNKTGPEVEDLIRKDVLLSLQFTKRVVAVYCGNRDVTDPLLSPVNGDLEILPPVLLQHGTDDLLVLTSRELTQKMEAAGKFIQYEEYKGMFHGFVLITKLPESKLAIRAQVKFLKA